ncbi:MAG: hypothetical protein HY695_13455 [Deltaproteobacteria bacterium]|nr:hypothetical protein [Deltaproteobacteria bacterium]
MYSRKHKTLTKAQFIRMSQNDLLQLQETARRLGMSTSEVTRRSLRIALPLLKTLALPGVEQRDAD